MDSPSVIGLGVDQQTQKETAGKAQQASEEFEKAYSTYLDSNGMDAVSYTHLDVYKRQGYCSSCDWGRHVSGFGFYVSDVPCGLSGRHGTDCRVWTGVGAGAVSETEKILSAPYFSAKPVVQ